jgi:hypothetical protein
MGKHTSGTGNRSPVTDSTVFAVGVVLTLAATILTLVITTVRAFSGFEVLASTFLVFTASTLVLLMVEIRRRSDRTHNIIDICDRIAGSSPGTAAFKTFGARLGDVLENYPRQPEIAIAWQTAIHRCTDTLEQLAQGHLVTRTSDQTYKLAFLHRGLTLKATSLLRTNLGSGRPQTGRSTGTNRSGPCAKASPFSGSSSAMHPPTMFAS